MSMEMSFPEFERREVLTPRQERALEREVCLDRLVSQAVGRKVDNLADEYLIEQINASYVGDNGEGAVLACLAEGCDRICVTANDSGTLEVVDASDEGVCVEIRKA